MKLTTTAYLLLLASLLVGCGGGGGGGGAASQSSGPTQADQPADPVIVEDPEVPDPEPEPEPEPDPDNDPGEDPEITLSCGDTEVLAVAAVAATDASGEFTAEKTLDSSLSDAARWSSDETTPSVSFDFGGPVKIDEIGLAWYLGDQRKSFYSIESSVDGDNWRPVLLDAESTGSTADMEASVVDAVVTRYLRVSGNGNSYDGETSLLEFSASGCRDEPISTSVSAFYGDELPVLEPYDHSGLNAGVAPSENFVLQYWYLSVPTDNDGNGRSDSIKEDELAGGYENPEYFYTAADGGMVFKSPVNGYKTSTNTSYVRVELREMLRGGNTSYSTQGVNKNNWVFGSAPTQARENAGGVDGRLFATLAVNEVTTTGENYQIGRVIIGQIHANDDEPARLYYRKLPGNSRGSVYFAHELVGGDEYYVELVGSRSNTAEDPDDGIALDEKFSYEIKVIGDFLRVSVSRPGLEPVSRIIDMSESGYNAVDQYQYFKLGAYHVNNSANVDEFARVTFYEVAVDHD